jgi:crotonobetainyl-CoA:carnitine CoA-transferase CaiB-like acyl-CoA transferase
MGAAYRLYKTSDHYLCVAIETQAQWQSLLAVMNIDEKYKDAFNVSTQSTSDEVQLTTLLQDAFAARSADAWFTLLDAAAVPCEIADPDFSQRMWQDESYLKDCNWLASFPHPVAGELGHVGVAYDLTATPARAKSRPLIVGESSREILNELGLTPEEQEALFADQVVADESCYMYDLGLGEQ